MTQATLENLGDHRRDSSGADAEGVGRGQPRRFVMLYPCDDEAAIDPEAIKARAVGLWLGGEGALHPVEKHDPTPGARGRQERWEGLLASNS